jgi:hypothetical protein
MASDVLSLWTVRANPSDFPGKFVARRHEIGAGWHGPTADHHIADTLEELRRALPPGLTRLERSAADDPVILESWL